MEKYVVGFAFTKNNEHAAYLVLLVKKNRPEWQKGCLNGIGGKIEEGELPIQAMHRECAEETGLHLDWLHKGVMRGTNNDGHSFECHIFYAYDDAVVDFKQMEDEILCLYTPSKLWDFKHIANLDYLIPLGLSDDTMSFITIEY